MQNNTRQSEQNTISPKAGFSIAGGSCDSLLEKHFFLTPKNINCVNVVDLTASGFPNFTYVVDLIDLAGWKVIVDQNMNFYLGQTIECDSHGRMVSM